MKGKPKRGVAREVGEPERRGDGTAEELMHPVPGLAAWY